MRNFVDANGTTWEVFEVRRASQRPESVRPGLEDGWLTFQSGQEKRRLGHYPPGWEALSDGELSLLCMRGLPVTRTRRAVDLLPSPGQRPGLAEMSLLLKVSERAKGKDA